MSCVSTQKHQMKNVNHLDSRNFMVFEEGIFIALLNQYMDITISKPTKKSIISLQYLKVDSVTIDNDFIKVSELIEKRCKAILERDKVSGIKVGSAVRRFTLNKTTEIHHFLMDLLQLFDYFYDSKMIAGKNGAMKIEIVETIYFNRKILFSKNDICLLGEKINLMLCDLVLKEKMVELKQNHPMFKEFLSSVL